MRASIVTSVIITSYALPPPDIHKLGVDSVAGMP